MGRDPYYRTRFFNFREFDGLSTLTSTNQARLLSVVTGLLPATFDFLTPRVIGPFSE